MQFRTVAAPDGTQPRRPDRARLQGRRRCQWHPAGRSRHRRVGRARAGLAKDLLRRHSSAPERRRTGHAACGRCRRPARRIRHPACLGSRERRRSGAVVVDDQDGRRVLSIRSHCPPRRPCRPPSKASISRCGGPDTHRTGDEEHPLPPTRRGVLLIVGDAEVDADEAIRRGTRRGRGSQLGAHRWPTSRPT